MLSFLRNIAKKLFNTHLDFRARLFNILAIAGILISLITGIMGIFIGAGLANLLLCLAAIVIASLLLWYSLVSAKYQLCYMITIISVFLGLFPALFFSVGGYHSGMPSYFIFAVLFTVFMLEGKKAPVMVLLELAVYTSLCFYARYNPASIKPFNTEAALFTDILVSFLVASVALAITMSLHFRLYKQRQKELEIARQQIEEYARMKSELFAAMSHEMRTPLTVMSAYAQYAVKQIRKSGTNEQTLNDLATISSEAERLAEMADGTLKILMTTDEIKGTDVLVSNRGQKIMSVDIGDLSSRLVRFMEPLASRKGCKLSVAIKNGMTEIPGDTDSLTQLLWNLLQNAITHSQSSCVSLTVETDEGGVTITVNDNGSGIEPDILPRIFERGISGKNGGSGLGLAICRDIAKLHGGDISVQSELGRGTCVTVTLHGIIERVSNE
jgi:signal transduction histidine kinase